MTVLSNEQPTIYAAYTALIDHNVQIAQITGMSVEELNERNARIIRARDMMPLAVAEAIMNRQ